MNQIPVKAHIKCSIEKYDEHGNHIETTEHEEILTPFELKKFYEGVDKNADSE